jgi:ribosomal protein S18 acetylase RimI-like enzyme
MTARDKREVMEILRGTPEFKPVEVQIAEELIDAYLDQGLNSGYFILVSTIDSRVAGYVCYGPTPLTVGTWDVYWMAVSREFQRHGVGRALLVAAEDNIRNTNGRLILIETSSKPDYIKAQNFYAGRGYDMISRIADFYELGDDKLTYLKRLA